MSNKLVAIVNHEPGVKNMLTLVFEARDLAVVSYHRGEDLLSMAIESNLGAVVMGTNMGANRRGYDICKSLLKRRPELPIIGLSADPKDCKKWIDSGASYFMAEPFRPYVLLNTVRSYLD